MQSSSQAHQVDISFEIINAVTTGPREQVYYVRYTLSQKTSHLTQISSAIRHRTIRSSRNMSGTRFRGNTSCRLYGLLRIDSWSYVRVALRYTLYIILYTAWSCSFRAPVFNSFYSSSHHTHTQPLPSCYCIHFNDDSSVVCIYARALLRFTRPSPSLEIIFDRIRDESRPGIIRL